jgi:hypothetical protein
MTLFRGLAKWAKNDITQGLANCTGMPSNQESKQSEITNLSLKNILMMVEKVL